MKMRVVGWCKALAVVACLFVGPPGALAQFLCPTQPGVSGGHLPAKAGCCASPQVGLQCTDVSPGLIFPGSSPAKIRRSAVLFVMDDHGYCQNGFMGGRCARTVPIGQIARRCTGRVCNNAKWISCSSVANCPSAGCGEAAPACLAADASQCNPGETCVEGYCSQGCTCTGSETGLAGECGCGTSEICVDGLCSPRAPCLGDFQCARGIDKCRLAGAPCPLGATTCTCQLDSSCTQDSDCNDKCQGDVCQRTPAPCGPNSDCAAGQVCTASVTPLRLNDLSCRYRVPGDTAWQYDPDAAPPAVREQVVYTPQIDQLAREGAVFPGHRGNGETCVPGRGALLSGRSLRHRDASDKNNGGTRFECQTTASSAVDLPAGCSPFPSVGEPECTQTSAHTGRCDRFHSIPWWLENPGGIAANADFYTLAAGKIEIGFDFDAWSFDNGIVNSEVALFAPSCADGDATCEPGLTESLNRGQIPDLATCEPSVGCTPAHAEQKSVRNIIAEIRSNVTAGVLNRSFFLQHAPNLPHEHNNAPRYFDELYSGTAADPTPGTDLGEEHLARTSWVDTSMQALIDELRRTCICGADEDANGTPRSDAGTPSGLKAVPESLWDNTTILVVQDNAYLMPEAKGEDTANENAHRGALIVNAPIHRDPESSTVFRGPKVLDAPSAFSSHADVLPTVLDYAGQSSPDSCGSVPCDNYPLNQSLRKLAEQGITAGGAPLGPPFQPYLRNASYSHRAKGYSTTADGLRAYIVPRPGAIGLCQSGTSAMTGPPLNHVRACLSDSDCGCPVPPATTPPCKCMNKDLDGDQLPDIGRRCANNAGILCTDDAQCAAGVCVTQGPGKVCNATSSPFRDFDGDSCVTDRDCVPKGVCRPLMLKAYAQGNPGARELTEVYDLNLTPDQGGPNSSINLLQADPGYLGVDTRPGEDSQRCPLSAQPVTLAQKLDCCLKEYWTLNATTLLWQPSTQNFKCPAGLRQWVAGP